MDKDKHKTKVIFRQWRESDKRVEGSVFALFPECPGTMNPKTCASYEHIGQHSSADYGCAIAYSRPIGQFSGKVKTLATELRGLGYNLEIVEKCTPEMYQARVDELYRPREKTA